MSAFLNACLKAIIGLTRRNEFWLEFAFFGGRLFDFVMQDGSRVQEKCPADKTGHIFLRRAGSSFCLKRTSVNGSYAVVCSSYCWQNSLKPSCSAVTRENPSADAAWSIEPNCSTSAEIVLPWQFALPGVPAFATASPARENDILKVVVPPTMSLPIRSQSGFRFEFRIHACASPANKGDEANLGADKYRKSPSARRTSGRKK